MHHTLQIEIARWSEDNHAPGFSHLPNTPILVWHLKLTPCVGHLYFEGIHTDPLAFRVPLSGVKNIPHAKTTSRC